MTNIKINQRSKTLNWISRLLHVKICKQNQFVSVTSIYWIVVSFLVDNPLCRKYNVRGDETYPKLASFLIRCIGLVCLFFHSASNLIIMCSLQSYSQLYRIPVWTVQMAPQTCACSIVEFLAMCIEIHSATVIKHFWHCGNSWNIKHSHTHAHTHVQNHIQTHTRTHIHKTNSHFPAIFQISFLCFIYSFQ